MIGLNALVCRNMKLFFKDKGLFFSTLITPLILLILYGTFLNNVYEDSFKAAVDAAGITVPEKLIGGCVGGQLTASLLAVCCVTVAFCCNLLMIQDKVTQSKRDLTVSPVNSRTISLGYYLATLASTLIVCFVAMVLCFAYMAKEGWYMDAMDVVKVIIDIFILTMFGTALSSIVNCFLSTQGQMSAVGTIVSAGYGFICGAYMPISQFSESLQKLLSFLPGTYGTSLLKNHTLRGVYEAMEDEGFPKEVVEAIKDSIDCNIYFYDEKVSLSTMYIIMAVTVAILICAYIIISMIRAKKKK